MKGYKMSKVQVKRGRKPEVRNAILVNLLQKGGKATVAELETTQGQIANMVKGGFVKATKERVATGGRGRPAFVYCLTLRGGNLARKLSA
jgi:predicted ArsR family transcriptional regulator